MAYVPDYDKIMEEMRCLEPSLVDVEDSCLMVFIKKAIFVCTRDADGDEELIELAVPILATHYASSSSSGGSLIEISVGDTKEKYSAGSGGSKSKFLEMYEDLMHRGGLAIQFVGGGYFI